MVELKTHCINDEYVRTDNFELNSISLPSPCPSNKVHEQFGSITTTKAIPVWVVFWIIPAMCWPGCTVLVIRGPWRSGRIRAQSSTNPNNDKQGKIRGHRS
jgi:hypothetical protein